MNRNRIAPPDGDFPNHMMVISFLTQLHVELYRYLHTHVTARNVDIFHILATEWHSYRAELVNCQKDKGHKDVLTAVDTVLYVLLKESDVIGMAHLERVDAARREIVLCVEHYRIMY